MHTAPPLRRAERVAAILERLSVDRSLSVAELAKSFGVSQATLRRDLQSLQEQRLLTRTHGGAHASEVSYELPIRYRDAHHREEKRRIAAVAVSRIPLGAHAVGLTGGTTTSEVARLLVDRIIFLGTPINDQVANVIVAQDVPVTMTLLLPSAATALAQLM